MLTIKSLLLASTYFLTQVAVLAAPIPLNAPLNDDAVFSRASQLLPQGQKQRPPPFPLFGDNGLLNRVPSSGTKQDTPSPLLMSSTPGPRTLSPLPDISHLQNFPTVSSVPSTPYRKA